MTREEVGFGHAYQGRAYKMKRTVLLLLLGLALLPHAVPADQAPASVCVDALEQLEALRTIAPVYKLYEKPGTSISS